MAQAGVEALVRAMRARDLVTASQILSHEPEIARGRTDEGTTLLLLAAYLHAEGFPDLLLSRGAVPDVWSAAALGLVPALDRLLDEDPARLQATSPDGWTPLHLAAHLGQDEAAERLLARGADVAARSDNALGNTPLHAAAAGGWPDLIALLVRRGAPLAAQDAGGNTPLHVAAAGGWPEAIEPLLAAGADPEATNDQGKTPRDVARERGKEAAARRLSPPRDR